VAGEKTTAVLGTGRIDAAQAPGPRRIPPYPPLNTVYFLAFLAFVVGRYIDIGSRMDILATIRFEFLLGGTAVIMASIQAAGRKPEIGQAKPIFVLIALLFVAMVFQIPFAADPPEAQRVFNDRVFKFALLSFLICTMVETPRAMKLFLAAFLFSIFYITLESVEGLINGGLVWENQGIQRLHGAVPMYGHPNSLGGVAMGSLPFVAFYFPRFRNWIIKGGLLAVACTSIICVIYSGSRTAYMGMLTLVIWWWFQSPHKARFAVAMVVCGAVALAVLPDEYIERFQSIGGHEAEGNSKETRIVILEDALTILAENPLGVGVASFPAVRKIRFNRSQDTHNLYLEVATNLGVQGFIIFMALVTAMMMAFRRTAFAFRRQRTRLARLVRQEDLTPGARRFIRTHDQDLQLLIASAQAGAGFVLIRLVLGLFGMDLYEIYWWFGAGLAFALSGLVVRTDQRTRAIEQMVASG